MFVVMSTVLFSIILSGIVFASWSSLGSGYAVTSNVHGTNAPFGMPVTVTAGTLDPSVTHVKFVWREPPNGNGAIRWEVVVPVFTNGTTGEWNHGGTAEIRYAESTQIPAVLGKWGVQARFQDSDDIDVPSCDVIKTKATSFNVSSFNTIPEMPMGTIGAAAAMVVALALFVTKKKSTSQAAKK